ncbi:MAG TPA: hypothetical protein H9912_00040 [Candidatus Eisenbergiella stercorigallinarum]|uniref:Uncharacterized protein n=1 Tax=Candidatus Eisenbergiella stercorigallinarum TaxID=2838557 RepID=A0A9D2TXS3_9FIRM|nr:hypothetical protein [Candidatus Eisenbergiella stercorigallinarum]
MKRDSAHTILPNLVTPDARLHAGAGCFAAAAGIWNAYNHFSLTQSLFEDKIFPTPRRVPGPRRAFQNSLIVMLPDFFYNGSGQPGYGCGRVPHLLFSKKC